jgi:hypothetical protein
MVRSFCGLVLGVFVFLGAHLNAAEPPKEASSGIARAWRLTIWQGEFSGIGLSLVTIQMVDGKPRLVPGSEKLKKWGRSISDLEFTDNVLRFKVTYDTSVDDTKTLPLKQEWFEGRFDPKNPNRIWGVLGPKDSAEDVKSFRYELLRPAELNPVPDQPEMMTLTDSRTGEKREVEDFRWSMASVQSPGLGAVIVQLNDLRAELAKGSWSSIEREFFAFGQYQILVELAANRKKDRRGFYMLCSLVRNAHLANMPPERVRGWLSEILEYAEAYGPRYSKVLRGSIAEELETGKRADYRPVIEELRSGKPFPTAELPKR